MKNLFKKFASFLTIVFALAAALAPVYRAQSLGTAVRIVPVPDGVYYAVDGQNYNHATSAIWPTGSKHVLSADVQQDGVRLKTRMAFSGWQYSGGQLLPGGSTVTITADPSITEYRAVFNVQYALSLVFYPCQELVCPSPGVIYQGSIPFDRDQDIWVGAGSTANLMAVPNPGYVFAGWVPGPGQVIKGTMNTVTLNEPVTVRPMFQVARAVTLATVPAGLQVLADRATVTTPVTFDWGWDSTHSVSPVSPQQDKFGNWWVFASWSDNGASTHAYQVGQSTKAETLTATYVAGTAVQLTTSPANLKLKVDGRDSWPSYSFLWGVGETHHLEAPATQIDAQGRLWQFNSWSNGGAAAQDLSITQDIATNGLRLMASYKPVGRLTVNSTLPGLTVEVDGTNCATPCDIQRPVGTEVHVSAPASIPQGEGVRADFNGFPGGGSEWTGTLGSEPVTLTASYRMMNRLAASATPPQGASWSLQPGSSDGYYDAQTSVAVSVSALPGYRFGSWSGDLSGSKPAGVVSMNLPRSVTARLERIPYISPAGVANAAGTTPQTAVAPGSVVAIFGASLANDLTVGPASPLAQTLAGLTVRSGERLLPLFFVSPTQINIQLPDDMGLGTQGLTVSSQGQPDVKADFTVARNAPGLFQATAGDQSFAVATHEDGSPVTVDSPAVRGELLTVYGTGFGPANRQRLAGFPVPADPPYLLVDPISVSLGDLAISGENAFAAPGRVGIDAVQFRLGEGAPTATNVKLKVSINGQDSNEVLLPVQ